MLYKIVLRVAQTALSIGRDHPANGIADVTANRFSRNFIPCPNALVL
jgi:hypothetical protein